MPRYHMQQTDKEITAKKELFGILDNGKYTTIALCNDNEPYIVTMTYGYDKAANALYFHAAKKGLKLDLIKQNPVVCGTVIEDHGYVMTECEQHYRSVVFWGELSVVDDLDEKKHGMHVLLTHQEAEPEPVKKRLLYEDNRYNKFKVLKLSITEITGKDGRKV